MMSGADLAALPAWAFAFVLVLSRCSAAVMLLPGFSETGMPTVVRAAIAVALVALILPGVGIVAPPDAWRTASMVCAELLTGGVLGWLARCIAMALPIAGQIISFMLGLSSVISPDPVLGQSSALMRLFSLAVPVLVLGSGLWAYPVEALAGSYTLVAPGALLPVTESTPAAVQAVSKAFALALQLSAPMVIANIAWHVALGVIARLLPQLQVYFAAMPGQIIGGLFLLAVLATGIVQTWSQAAHDGFATLPGL